MPPPTINSIYVRYSTPNVDTTITTADLQRIFTPYGVIEDVSIKVSSIDQVSSPWDAVFVVRGVGAERCCHCGVLSAVNRRTSG